ncbi:MAG: NAD kinase [Flexibacteraceae bacterium]
MKIAIHGKQLKANEWQWIQLLLHKIAGHHVEIAIEENFFKACLTNGITFPEVTVFNEFEKLPRQDLFLSIGGDGTLLDTIPFVEDSNSPILCLNAGRLGFLSTAQLYDIEYILNETVANHTYLEERSLLEISVKGTSQQIYPYALNELSIMKTDTSSMIVVHTKVDGIYVNSYWADGLILATPTGSTGYSMSCGGPIMLPQSETFVITPVSPHSLTARPLIVPSSAVFQFQPESRNNNFLISADSRSYRMEESTEIEVKKASFTIKLLRLNEDNFIKTLKNKLNWGWDYRNS